MYPYKTEPFKHQTKTLQTLWRRGWGGGILFDPGTGKTKTALDFVGALYLYRRVRRVLVICPINAFSTWAEQPKIHCPPEVPFAIEFLNGSRSVYKLYELESYHPDRLRICVVNFETAWRISKQLLKWKPQVVIVDESHKIKSAATHKARGVHKFASAPYRLILTGTVFTNSPLDAYSQWRFLNPQRFGKSYTKFRDTYARMGGYGGYEIEEYINLNSLAQQIALDATVVKKEECLDLPPKLSQAVSIELRPNTKKLYRQMEKEMIAQLAGVTITAQIVLTKLLRLSQMASGFVTQDGVAHFIGTEKLEALADLLEDYCIEPRQKVVVFCRFIPSLMRIEEVLEELKIPFVTLRGGMSSKQRAEAQARFVKAKGSMVLLGQIEAAGISIDLSCSSTAIFYELDYSSDHHIQAQDRLHRIGQNSRVLYLYLMTKDTVDEDIRDSLSRNERITQAVLDRVRRRVGGSNNGTGKELTSLSVGS